jgi:hypothetical protein
VRVGDQNAGRLLVRSEHAHGLPALNEQRLVVLQSPQRPDDRLVALPVSRRLSGAAVDDELVRILGDVRVQVVHQHPEGGFLVPALAADLGSGGCPDRPGESALGHGEV